MIILPTDKDNVELLVEPRPLHRVTELISGWVSHIALCTIAFITYLITDSNAWRAMTMLMCVITILSTLGLAPVIIVRLWRNLSGDNGIIVGKRVNGYTIDY